MSTAAEQLATTGAATTTAAATGATTTAAATGATTGAATTAATPPADFAWAAGLSPELRGFVENKGWKQQDAAVTSYVNLEKTIGMDKLALPKDEKDTEGWNTVYNKLGRPATAADYKLPVPEGQDGSLAKTAGEWFHEAGLSTKQAQAVVGKWNEFQAKQAEAEIAAVNQRYDQEEAALKTEWGAQHGPNMEIAKRAARQFALDAPTIDALEAAMGPGKLFKFLHKIGAGLGEHPIEGATGTPGAGGMTPEAAEAKMQELGKDPEFRKRLANGDSAAKEEWSRLNKFRFPGATPIQS